ncbi:MAG: hypothetical protein PVI11_01905 [Candidatus Aminicenantes bacterium]|jgi:hypothetical protein
MIHKNGEGIPVAYLSGLKYPFPIMKDQQKTSKTSSIQCIKFILYLVFSFYFAVAALAHPLNSRSAHKNSSSNSPFKLSISGHASFSMPSRYKSFTYHGDNDFYWLDTPFDTAMARDYEEVFSAKNSLSFGFESELQLWSFVTRVRYDRGKNRYRYRWNLLERWHREGETLSRSGETGTSDEFQEVISELDLSVGYRFKGFTFSVGYILFTLHQDEEDVGGKRYSERVQFRSFHGFGGLLAYKIVISEHLFAALGASYHFNFKFSDEEENQPEYKDTFSLSTQFLYSIPKTPLFFQLGIRFRKIRDGHTEKNFIPEHIEWMRAGYNFLVDAYTRKNWSLSITHLTASIGFRFNWGRASPRNQTSIKQNNNSTWD